MTNPKSRPIHPSLTRLHHSAHTSDNYNCTPTPTADHLGTSVTIAELTYPQFVRNIDQLINIHLAAMDYPRSTFNQRKSLWLSNAHHPDFHCYAAINPVDSSIVGVAFGFRGGPKTWWYTQVERGLLQEGLPLDAARTLLSHYMEISEVHVHPCTQGQGIGQRLLGALLDTPQFDRFLLSTPEVAGEDNHAWHLYRRMGFTDILRNFYFPQDPRPFGILGFQRTIS